jgi:DNA-binding helix-hairpin-helix protein with protein kinase domain
MRHIAKPVLLLAALAAIAGCGGSSGGGGSGQGGQGDEVAIRGVMLNLQRYARAGNASAICTQIFAPQLSKSISATASSHSCVTEVKRQVATPQETITVKSVQISGPTNATTVVTEQNGRTSTLYMVKQGGKWRVRSIVPPLTQRAKAKAAASKKKGGGK